MSCPGPEVAGLLGVQGWPGTRRRPQHPGSLGLLGHEVAGYVHDGPAMLREHDL